MRQLRTPCERHHVHSAQGCKGGQFETSHGQVKKQDLWAAHHVDLEGAHRVHRGILLLVQHRHSTDLEPNGCYDCARD